MCKINYVREKGVGALHALEGFRSPKNAFETFKEEKRDSLSANSTRNRGVQSMVKILHLQLLCKYVLKSFLIISSWQSSY